MKRMVVGVLGLGVAGALAASGAAVAHIVTTSQRTASHAGTVTSRQNAAAKSDDGGDASMMSGTPSMGTTGGTGAHLRVYLRTLQGERNAQVDIVQLAQGGNLVSVSAWNLLPGFHTIQLDSVGSCDRKTGFASAGRVLQPLPVLAVGANGKGKEQFVMGSFKIKDLADQTGTSIVIHHILPSGLSAAQAATMLGDDNQPRIACGVAFKTKVPVGGNSPTPSPMPSSSPASPAPPVPSQPGTVPSTQYGQHW